MEEMVQLRFPFAIKEVEIDGIEMGVLNDGTAYLSQRGLAKMCGVDRKVISALTDNWAEEQNKPRGKTIAEHLRAVGYDMSSLYIETRGATSTTFAYSDAVCMAVLEYYAFDSTQGNNETALKNYRLLARSSFKTFIYQQVGYTPEPCFIGLEQRLLLNASLPVGYWSILIESSDIMLQLARVGLDLNSTTVPDISIGIAWSSYWKIEKLFEQHGESKKYRHQYPKGYPQADAKIEAAIYPNTVLPIFRKWLQEIYIPNKLQPYLRSKVTTGHLLAENIPMMIEAVTRPTLNMIESH